LREQQASWLAALQRAQEPAACAPLEQPLSVLLVHSALPRAQRAGQARSVSRHSAQHLLAQAPELRQVSSVQPSQPLPSLLFLFWPPLPLALLLRRRPESFSAPSQRRPPELSSSASSSP